MPRFKRLLALSVPGPSCSAGRARTVLGGRLRRARPSVLHGSSRTSLPPRRRPRRRHPRPDLEFLWVPSEPELIKDEPLPVTVPAGLQPLTPKVVVPASNPITKGKYELGRQLYFDPRISLDGTVSCATCHNPAKGWTDGNPVSTGINGPDREPQCPDGLQHRLRQVHVLGRPGPVARRPGPGSDESTRSRWASRSTSRSSTGCERSPATSEQFEKVFGTESRSTAWPRRSPPSSGSRPSPATRSTTSTTRATTKPSPRARSGAWSCSASGSTPTTSSSPASSFRRPSARSATSGRTSPTSCSTTWASAGTRSNKKFNDLGRWAIVPIGAKNDADSGAFKTPTVRDVAQTGPYMHDGSMKTLEEVVEHYDKGGNPNPSLDQDMKPAQPDAAGDGRPGRVHEGPDRRDQELEELLPTLPPGPTASTPDPGRP